MTMNILFRLFFLLNLQPSPTPVDYNAPLRSPLDIELLISGNFGELRPNHFHTGIDFKTNGKEGYKLYAIADGYISRIKTGTTGYGKVLYIDHPQYGITSVYAHCQSFTGAIAEYTLLAQMKQEFYEMDLQIPRMALTVKKGDLIALSGSTGNSFAPHLHFEIRETSSEDPLNPLLFQAYKIEDSRAPHIQQVVIYALSKYGYRIPDLRLTAPVKFDKGSFSIANDTLKIPAHFCSEHGGVGLALEAHDKHNASENLCGVYSSILLMNSDTLFYKAFNRLNFDLNRQINTHKDYESYQKNKAKIEKYFRTIHNELPIYATQFGKGILGLQPDHNYQLEFLLSDVLKNTSRLKFIVQTLQGELRKEDTPFDKFDKSYLYPDSVYFFQEKQYKIKIGNKTLFEPIKKKLSFNNGKLVFGEHPTATNESLEIQFALSPIHLKYADKVVMLHEESKSFNTGKVDGDWFVSKSKNLGSFRLDIDTLAPQITRKFKVLTTPQHISKLSWTIKDDKSGLSHYALYINDLYHVLEYEHKNNEIFANVQLSSGTHQIKMIVKDAVGNIKEDQFELMIK